MDAYAKEFGTSVPGDAIPIGRAVRASGVDHKTILELLRAGLVRVGVGKIGGITALLLSLPDLLRAKNLRPGALVPDAEPIGILAKRENLSRETIRKWLEWDPHPALGRKIRSGVGPTVVTHKNGSQYRIIGRLASASDVKACAEFFRSPLLKRFPGVPGCFIARGVFRHDRGDLWYSAKHLESLGLVPDPTYASHPVYLGKLERIKTVWPHGRGAGRRWELLVYSERSAQQLNIWRQGATAEGRWIGEGVWRDDNGMTSYSSKWILAQTGKQAGNLETQGLLSRGKLVPGPGTGRSERVYPESDVAPMVGIATPRTSGQGTPKRQAPNAGYYDPGVMATYQLCFEQYIDGRKLSAILKQIPAEDRPDEEAAVTVYAKRFWERRRTDLDLPSWDQVKAKRSEAKKTLQK